MSTYREEHKEKSSLNRMYNIQWTAMLQLKANHVCEEQAVPTHCLEASIIFLCCRSWEYTPHSTRPPWTQAAAESGAVEKGLCTQIRRKLSGLVLLWDVLNDNFEPRASGIHPSSLISLRLSSKTTVMKICFLFLFFSPHLQLPQSDSLCLPPNECVCSSNVSSPTEEIKLST